MPLIEMKIAIVLGTRPEIIKMSPVVRELERRNEEYLIVHTGQHYSHNMDAVFFEQLRLPPPKINLNVGSGTHGEETGKMIIGIERALQEQRPDIVLVEGDTNSVLSGALAASKLHIGVGHVEAGLRSFDRTMPEEINRVLTDHISNYLFAPTDVAKENLMREGIKEESIFVTGNTIVDAVHQNLELATSVDVGSTYQVADGEYFLLTLHRQENVDDPERLRQIFEGLHLLASRFDKGIIFPMHPRTRERMKQDKIRVRDERIKIIEPLDYLTFLKLESRAGLVLTDSGGVQEEACILGVPCVTLRYNTERPETVEVGANIVAGTEPGEIVRCAEEMLQRSRDWKNPFGDGHAATRIASILEQHPPRA